MYPDLEKDIQSAFSYIRPAKLFLKPVQCVGIGQWLVRIKSDDGPIVIGTYPTESEGYKALGRIHAQKEREKFHAAKIKAGEHAAWVAKIDRLYEKERKKLASAEKRKAKRPSPEARARAKEKQRQKAAYEKERKKLVSQPHHTNKPTTPRTDAARRQAVKDFFDSRRK